MCMYLHAIELVQCHQNVIDRLAMKYIIYHLCAIHAVRKFSSYVWKIVNAKGIKCALVWQYFAN